MALYKTASKNPPVRTRIVRCKPVSNKNLLHINRFVKDVLKVILDDSLSGFEEVFNKYLIKGGGHNIRTGGAALCYGENY